MTAETTIIGQCVLVLLALIALWKSSRDQKYQLAVFKLEHDAERIDRDVKAKDLAVTVQQTALLLRDRTDASAVRLQDKLEVAAKDVRDRVDFSAKDVRDRLDVSSTGLVLANQVALDTQTIALRHAIEEAKQYTAIRADAAYHEANSVNTKLEKLHVTHEKQGQVLQALLEVIQAQPQLRNIQPALNQIEANTAATVQELKGQA